MTAINRYATVLSGALVLASVCAHGQNAPQAKPSRSPSESSKARQLLFQVLNRTSNHNVKAVVSQLLPDGSNGYEQFQVLISKTGKIRQTILEPLTMQGIEAIDDLSHSYTYYPDRNLLTIQDSPRKVECDAEFRMALAQRNYTIRLEPRDVRVAGQAASVVVAVPHHDELETRRFYIDSKTGFLLRLETVRGSDTTVRVETKTISYPSTLPDNAFDLRTPDDVRKHVYNRMETSVGTAGNNSVTFVPVRAFRNEQLPMGFRVQDVQVNDTDKVKSVAVRITDGLVKGTVYQMPARSQLVALRAMTGTTVQTAGTVRFIVAAEVPEKVREALLRYFAEQSRSNGGPIAWDHFAYAGGRLELDYVPEALWDGRGLENGQKLEIRVTSPADSIRAAHSLQGKLVTIQVEIAVAR